MPRARRIWCLLAPVCLVTGAFAQSDGGKYTVTIDRSKPLEVSGMAFANGDPFRQGGQLPAATATQLTITTPAGRELLPAVVRTCMTGGRFSRVVATYTSALKHVEYTIELKKVSVLSVTFPGADKSSKVQGNLSWTLEAESGQLNYEMLKDPGGLSKANHERLERARARVQATLWEQIKHKSWQAPRSESTSPLAGAFSLSIDGSEPPGIVSLGPLTVTRPFKATAGATAAGGSLVFMVEAAESAGFTAALKSGKMFGAATVSYTRRNEAGEEENIRISFKSLTVKSCSAVDDKAVPPIAAVELAYESLELEFGK